MLEANRVLAKEKRFEMPDRSYDRQLAASEPRFADAADTPSSVFTTTKRKFRSPPHTGYASMLVTFTRTSGLT